MKPCKHPDTELPEQGEPYQPGACRVCWLFVNEPKYRELWGKKQPPRLNTEYVHRPKKCGCREGGKPAV